MIYMEKKIEAYYSKKELLFLTILFIVSFGVVLCTGILADRGSLTNLLMVAFIVSMSICGGIEGYTILKLSKVTSETLGKLIMLILIAFPVFIAGVLIFLPHYIYSIWANIREVR